MVGLILLAVVVIAVLWTIGVYNGLVRRRNIVAEAWAGIETQLKRRADLIPNLVETVKGYAAHERTTFDELARLRSTAQSAAASPSAGGVEARAETERQITAMIGRVMAVAENYPELKASANFQQLQSDLASVEDQIQLARRYYNGAVRDYNVAIQQFPSNLIANSFGFTASPFFQIENAQDREVPKVAFS